MQIEYSTFFIKPEAEALKSEILEAITRRGLRVVVKKEVVLTEDILRGLYERLTRDEEHRLIWEATRDHLMGKTVPAGVVKAHNAISKLVELCGQSTKPASCADNTIRKIVGLRFPGVRCGKYMFWKNGIHRAKNRDEVARDLRLLFPDLDLQ